jgi:hypothetical protein
MVPNGVSSNTARLDLLEQVNTYLARLIELDANSIEQHLARLDYLLGLESLGDNHVADDSSSPAVSTSGVNSHSIRAEVEAADIPLDCGLETLVLASHPEVIRDAIAVVQENRKRGIVHSPSGLFRRAVENHWKPRSGRKNNVKV